MKLIIATSVVLLAFGASHAMADCTSQTRVVGNALQNLISNSLVCGKPAANYPGDASDRWQEEHMASGALFDYKLGPNHPIDPRKEVGTWSIEGDNVTHSYTGGGSYSWSVHQINSGDSYSFCDGNAEHVRAFIRQPNPGSGCGGSFP